MLHSVEVVESRAHRMMHRHLFSMCPAHSCVAIAFDSGRRSLLRFSSCISFARVIFPSLHSWYLPRNAGRVFWVVSTCAAFEWRTDGSGCLLCARVAWRTGGADSYEWMIQCGMGVFAAPRKGRVRFVGDDCRLCFIEFSTNAPKVHAYDGMWCNACYLMFAAAPRRWCVCTRCVSIEWGIRHDFGVHESLHTSPSSATFVVSLYYSRYNRGTTSLANDNCFETFVLMQIWIARSCMHAKMTGHGFTISSMHVTFTRLMNNYSCGVAKSHLMCFRRCLRHAIIYEWRATIQVRNGYT